MSRSSSSTVVHLSRTDYQCLGTTGMVLIAYEKIVSLSHTINTFSRK